MYMPYICVYSMWPCIQYCVRCCAYITSLSLHTYICMYTYLRNIMSYIHMYIHLCVCQFLEWCRGSYSPVFLEWECKDNQRERETPGNHPGQDGASRPGQDRGRSGHHDNRGGSEADSGAWESSSRTTEGQAHEGNSVIICVYSCVCMHVRTYASMYIRMFVCMYVRMYMCPNAMDSNPLLRM